MIPLLLIRLTSGAALDIPDILMAVDVRLDSSRAVEMRSDVSGGIGDQATTSRGVQILVEP